MVLVACVMCRRGEGRGEEVSMAWVDTQAKGKFRYDLLILGGGWVRCVRSRGIVGKVGEIGCG